MQAKIHKIDATNEIKGRTFTGSPSLDLSEDTSAMMLHYRPYYNEDQVPVDGVYSENGFWGRNIVVSDCMIDGRNCAEGLKISFGHNIVIKDCIIHGGYEDCVDIVRGANIFFNRCKFISHNTKQHFTIKGGARTVRILDCEFVNDFRSRCDGAIIDIGNWTNYDIISRPKTRDIIVENCTLTNIKFKLLSRILHGVTPKVINTKGTVFRVPRLITMIFFYLRRCGKLGSVVSISDEDRALYTLE